jgi:asparagine N-glycosylation enzyme membrane subunit Stt3
MFSIIGFVFIIALIYIFYKKEFFKKEIYLLLIWFIFFLGMAIYMPHKEDRFILAIVPPLSLISGYFINKIKKYRGIILIGIVFVSLFSVGIILYITYNDSQTDTNKCFLEANKFLKSLDDNSVILTDESAVIYYYTKLETRFYPNPWDYETLQHWVKKDYLGRDVYILFGNYITKPVEEYQQIKLDLDSNLEKTFECVKEEGYSVVYKY